MPKLSSEIVFVLYFSLFFKYIIIFLSEIISMKFTSAIKSILLLLVHLLRFIFNCGVRSSRTRNTRVSRGLKSLWSKLSEERGTTWPRARFIARNFKRNWADKGTEPDRKNSGSFLTVESSL